MFSERLKQKRIEKGLSQAELARRVGVGRDSYNKYERAGVRPSHETLVALATELNTTVDYLLTGSVDVSDLSDAKKPIQDDINLDELQFALFGEVRELDDEDIEELIKDARRMRELQELRKRQKEGK